jgi:hypothetical protein
MAIYYAVVESDPLDNGGDSHVIEGASHSTIQGPDGRLRGQTYLGHQAWCAVCQSAGIIAAGSGISDSLRGWDGRLNAMEAVGGDVVLCQCARHPRIVPIYGRLCQYIDERSGRIANTPASDTASAWPPAEANEELEHYFELIDAKTGAPVEGMTYKLSSGDQCLVYDATLADGRTRAFPLKEHPNLAFVAWREGNAR